MTINNVLEQLKDRLKNFIEKKGLRNSRQRMAILEIISDMDDHFSIDELYQKTKSIYPQIGYATIYRTVNLFVDAGILHRRNFHNDSPIYEIILQQDHHDHIICLGCGKIIEFNNERMERIQNYIAKQFNFEPKFHRFEMYGYCEKCKKEN